MKTNAEYWSRREFLGRLVLAGTAGVVGLQSARLTAGLLGTQRALAAEPPPEVSTIRFHRLSNAYTLCIAPQYYAEELLRAEGFRDVQYSVLGGASDVVKALASGQIDFAMQAPGALIVDVDAGSPIVMLGGVHVGCFELFGTDSIRNIRDVKGKTVAAGPVGGPRQIFLAGMLAYVGLDPRKNVHWVGDPPAVAMRLLAQGKVDAFFAWPPETQELHAKKIGHAVVNTMMDRPWSQYFCCLVGANREFVGKHPVATKRVLRAILKAADVCARDPQRVARFLVDRGYADRYDYALQAMKDVPYDRWREYSSEDTVRFYALWLRDAGLIKHTPGDIIARGTDWRYLNEIKKELKGAEMIPGGPFHFLRHG